MNQLRLQILFVGLTGFAIATFAMVRSQNLRVQAKSIQTELQTSFQSRQLILSLGQIQPTTEFRNRLLAQARARNDRAVRDSLEALTFAYTQVTSSQHSAGAQGQYARGPAAVPAASYSQAERAELLRVYRQALARAVQAEQSLSDQLMARLDSLNQSEAAWQTGSLISLAAALIWIIGIVQLRIFKIIRRLNRRMMDFLLDRYSFQFSAPEANELGDLQRTFNALAQRVINTTDDLKKLDQAKSEFLSIASHELRTPMTSIKGSLALLASSRRADTSQGASQPPQDDRADRLIRIAEAETDRLIRLINELLDLAKIEAGGLPLQQRWVSWQDLASQALDGLSGLATQAGVELQLAEQPATEFNVDRDRIHQVVTNLVSNAIKFSPKGSTVTVWLSKTQNNDLQINITDQGPGIRKDDQKLIFEKFRQGATRENPLVKGTGLGLAIAKALVAEHGGSIGVESELGQGSTFWFTLSQWRTYAGHGSEVFNEHQ